MPAKKQLQTHVIFIDGNIWVFETGLKQTLLNFPAGQILAVKNPAPGMAAFAAQCKIFAFSIILTAEANSIGKEAINEARTRLHHPAYNLLIAKTVTGSERVLNMVFEIIHGRNRRGYAALGVIRIALATFFLCHHSDGALLRRQQCKLKPCNA